MITSAAMDALKIAGLSGTAVAVILTACSRELPTPPQPSFTIQLRPCCDAPPELLIHDPRVLERQSTIILVRVIGFEMLDPERNSVPAHATMLVIRSWKGPFSAGDVLQTPRGYFNYSGALDDMVAYPFQSGDQGNYFLIMPMQIEDQYIWVYRHSAWPAEKSQALMAALDQAVADSLPTDKAGYIERLRKALAALEDLTPKLLAAQNTRAELVKQLPNDPVALIRAQAEIEDLRNQVRGHEENAARWEGMLRVQGWTPPHPLTASALRSDR